MTDISLYNATPWREADDMTRRILALARQLHIRNPRITDATSNVGGNLINFYLNGVHCLNAVEFDPLTCGILEHNLTVYGIAHSRTGDCDVRVYNGSYADLYRDIEQDVLFVDPPWGGPGYDQVANLELFLGRTNVADIITDLFARNRVRIVAYKIPVNYNVNGLMRRLVGVHRDTHRIMRRSRGQMVHSYTVLYLHKV